MRKQNIDWKTSRNLLALVLAVVLLLSNDPALAWGKKKKEAPKKEPAKAVNLEKHPSRDLYRGTLHKDIYQGWYLDEHLLSFNRNSRISATEGSSGGTELQDGREALVTAANVGGTLVVYRVTMISQKEMMERGSYNLGIPEEELEAMSSSTPK